MAKSKAQKALAAGPSKIGSKARAAANKLKEVKSSASDKLYTGKRRKNGSPDSKLGYEFGGKHSKGAATGKHAAPATKESVRKNAMTPSNAPSTGKHSKEAKLNSLKNDISEKRRLKKLVGR